MSDEAVVNSINIEVGPSAEDDDLLSLDEGRDLSSIKAVRARLRKPSMTAEDYLAMLDRQTLPQAVAWLNGAKD